VPVNLLLCVRFFVFSLTLLPLTTVSADEPSVQQWTVKMLRDSDCDELTEDITVRAFLHPSRHGARISDYRSWRTRGLSASTAEIQDNESARILTKFIFDPQQYRSNTFSATFRGRLLCDTSESGNKTFLVRSVSDVRIEASTN
jgi:hypothetical protein